MKNIERTGSYFTPSGEKLASTSTLKQGYDHWDIENGLHFLQTLVVVSTLNFGQELIVRFVNI
jgi:hypothetical protein